jgi:hypothetical protein
MVNVETSVCEWRHATISVILTRCQHTLRYNVAWFVNGVTSGLFGFCGYDFSVEQRVNKMADRHMTSCGTILALASRDCGNPQHVGTPPYSIGTSLGQELPGCLGGNIVCVENDNR